jgi:phosphocarrier protein
VIERELLIGNRLGLHARATAKLVQVLSGYRCNATLTAKGREVNAKSIMGVMLLAAGMGTPVLLRVDGDDEADAAAAIVDLFERRFDEDSCCGCCCPATALRADARSAAPGCVCRMCWKSPRNASPMSTRK